MLIITQAEINPGIELYSPRMNDFTGSFQYLAGKSLCNQAEKKGIYRRLDEKLPSWLHFHTNHLRLITLLLRNSW